MSPRHKAIHERKRREKRNYKMQTTGGVKPMESVWLHDTVTGKAEEWPNTIALASHLGITRAKLQNYLKTKAKLQDRYVISREEYLNEINTDLI